MPCGPSAIPASTSPTIAGRRSFSAIRGARISARIRIAKARVDPLVIWWTIVSSTPEE